MQINFVHLHEQIVKCNIAAFGNSSFKVNFIAAKLLSFAKLNIFGGKNNFSKLKTLPNQSLKLTLKQRGGKKQLWYLESLVIAFMFSVINKNLINALNASRSLAPVR